LSLYDAADTDVVVMDQLGLLIGIGIAAAAGEGSHGGTIFSSNVPKRGAPIMPQLFLGHTSRDSIPQIIDFKGLLVDAQGIEPWISPV
jgi:hypothetical protein